MSKVRIRAGEIEIEYEGDEIITKDDLFEIIEKLSDLRAIAVVPPPPNPHSPGMGAPANPGSGKIEISTKSIAQKLGSKSCGDVAFAASCHLALVQGKEKFSRKKIIEEMKNATGFIKKSMRGSNLSSALDSLVANGKLSEPSKEVYSLTHSAETEVLSKIG